MEAFDFTRAAVTQSLGLPPTSGDQEQWDRLGLDLALIYRQVQLSNLQLHIIAANNLLPFFARRRETRRLVEEADKISAQPLRPLPLGPDDKRLPEVKVAGEDSNS